MPEGIVPPSPRSIAISGSLKLLPKNLSFKFSAIFQYDMPKGIWGKLFPPAAGGKNIRILFLLLFFIIVGGYPKMAAKSSSGVLMGMILNFSTKMFKTLGETKAGRLGPRRMSLMPR